MRAAGATVSAGYISHLSCLAKWVDGAYTTITVGEKLAAAMMATSIAPEVITDLKLPWKAFVIPVPGGCFVPTTVSDPGRSIFRRS